MSAPAVWVVGTFDTKAAELNYMANLIRVAGVPVVTVDIGTRSEAGDADIDAATVAGHHPLGAARVLMPTDRGEAVVAMGQALSALVAERLSRGEIAGMLGAGGSGGTSMIAPAMRLLPVGRPKLMVSTMAAGNVAPYVDVVDMTMMYPVTDIAGLNRLSRTILANAAHAMAGMVANPVPRDAAGDKPTIGLTMFGVTTPCVQAVCTLLQDDFDTQVFHANGSGGRTLEALAAAGMLQAVIDITTTEVGQHLAGGVCDAGPHRLDAAARHGLPWIGSVGALDMINWGAPATIPVQHQGRRFHAHNADVTLMRSSGPELQAAGRHLASRLNQSRGPVSLLLPMGGLSMIDTPGQPFHDPAADQVLFETLERFFKVSSSHRLICLPHHINAPEFSVAIAAEVRRILQ